MIHRHRTASRAALLGGLLLVAQGWSMAFASPVLYSNLLATNAMATASRPESGSGATRQSEVESADDFVLATAASIDHATFIGLLPPGAALSSIVAVRIEIYRVFPNDSNTTRTPQVPTRTNSPSDVALDERDSTLGQANFTAALLSATFTALNSVQPGGIHPAPNQTTGGNGPVTGEEVQFDVDLTTPILLAADHYFFIPQVQLSNGTFLWLSASRPISGGTPIAPDLQSWTRDENLDPDWLRIGTDIVGGGAAFNAAFALNGVVRSAAVPEPGSIALLAAGVLGAMATLRRRRQA